MVYTNGIIRVIDIQFKTVISVLKEKQCYRKKSSSLGPDVVWKFRESFLKGNMLWSNAYGGIVFQVQRTACGSQQYKRILQLCSWGRESKGVLEQEAWRSKQFFIPNKGQSLDIWSKMAQLDLSLETFTLALYREWIGK